MKRWVALASHCPSQRHRRGVETLEFALTFPLLILLTVGIFEFGRALWIMHSLEEALNVTGRYAMYNPATSDSALKTYFGNHITAVPADAVTLSFSSSVTGTMPFTTITAQYNFIPVTSLIPKLSITLSSSSRVPRV